MDHEVLFSTLAFNGKTLGKKYLDLENVREIFCLWQIVGDIWKRKKYQLDMFIC